MSLAVLTLLMLAPLGAQGTLLPFGLTFGLDYGSVSNALVKKQFSLPGGKDFRAWVSEIGGDGYTLRLENRDYTFGFVSNQLVYVFTSYANAATFQESLEVIAEKIALKKIKSLSRNDQQMFVECYVGLTDTGVVQVRTVKQYSTRYRYPTYYNTAYFPAQKTKGLGSLHYKIEKESSLLENAYLEQAEAEKQEAQRTREQ